MFLAPQAPFRAGFSTKSCFQLWPTPTLGRPGFLATRPSYSRMTPILQGTPAKGASTSWGQPPPGS